MLDDTVLLVSSRGVFTGQKQLQLLENTVKPVLRGHSKLDKTKILMTNSVLMNVKIFAECSLEHSAILLTCIKR